MLKFSFLAFLLALSGVSNADTKKESLTIGITQEFESLNPLVISMVASTYITGAVNRPLSYLNKEWQWQCGLCETIPTLESGGSKFIGKGDKKKLVSRWQIRKDAKWGDGKPVTGHDFRLSWQIGSSKNVAVPANDLYLNIEEIEVDEKNPKVFTIYFKKPRYDYNQLTLNPMPSHIEGSIWAKTKDEAGAYAKATAYSTDSANPGLYVGPYKIKEIKLGSHVVIEKNDYWFGEKPSIDNVVFKYIPNTQTLEANLLSGNIDMVSVLGMTFDQAIAFEKRINRKPHLKSKYEIKFEEGLVYEHIDLNLDHPTLKDVRVRHALKHSIDTKKLTDALFKGRQKPATSFLHPKDPFYTEKVEKFSYDLDKANKLLDEAGWGKKSDGYRYHKKTGEKMTLNIMTTAQNKTRELIEVWLQNEWKKIGIDITIKNEPARVFFGETVNKRKFPALAMFAWLSNPDQSKKSLFHSKNIPSEKNGWVGQNYTGWSNPEVDKLLEAYDAEFDIAKRKQFTEKIAQHYVQDTPVIPLYLRSDIAVVPHSLLNHQITGHIYSGTFSIEKWRFEEQYTSTN